MITGRAVGRTETTCRSWSLGLAALLSGSGHALPVSVQTRFRFAPQTAGVARGTGANVKLYEVAVMLGEIVEELV